MAFKDSDRILFSFRVVYFKIVEFISRLSKYDYFVENDATFDETKQNERQ